MLSSYLINEIYLNIESKYIRSLTKDKKDVLWRLVLKRDFNTNCVYRCYEKYDSIINFINNLNIEELSYNKNLTSEIIEYIGYDNEGWDWELISENIILTIEFIKKYRKVLDINSLSLNKTLTYRIMGFMTKKIKNWSKLLENIKLSMSFIETYVDLIDIKSITKNKSITIEMIEYINIYLET